MSAAAACEILKRFRDEAEREDAERDRAQRDRAQRDREQRNAPPSCSVAHRLDTEGAENSEPAAAMEYTGTFSTDGQVLFIGLPRSPGRTPALPKKDDGTPQEHPEGYLTFVAPTRRGSFRVQARKTSLLNYNFNKLWAAARNHDRDDHLTHFAMQHDDIIPHAPWADTLIDEMERFGADVCSAVVPIKDDRGLTSTALRNVATGETRRLTMAEVMRLPVTFDVHHVTAAGIDVPGRDRDKILAVNTGLWVCEWRRPWVKQFRGFRVQDDIHEMADGTCVAKCLSEDWLWSEWATKRGVRFCASRAVPLAHVDDEGKEYRNDHGWGTWKEDTGDAPEV